jgi:hypothetical protein
VPENAWKPLLPEKVQPAATFAWGVSSIKENMDKRQRINIIVETPLHKGYRWQTISWFRVTTSARTANIAVDNLFDKPSQQSPWLLDVISTTGIEGSTQREM